MLITITIHDETHTFLKGCLGCTFNFKYSVIHRRNESLGTFLIFTDLYKFLDPH